LLFLINVYAVAGIAVMVQMGRVKAFSDIGGRHIARLTNDEAIRNRVKRVTVPAPKFLIRSYGDSALNYLHRMNPFGDGAR
jgi:hypothetical protein